MEYISLYRKYRPKTFSDVVGQEVVVKILKNSIINNKISHAYIFSGPRGTGKTSIAKIFSKAVNCLETTDGDLCNHCTNCLTNFDEEIDIIEIDLIILLASLESVFLKIFDDLYQISFILLSNVFLNSGSK